MPSTSPLGLRTPPSTGVTPDVPRDMLALAEDVQQAIGSLAAPLQEGVLDAGSFEVTQASGGASMVLDVASNVGSGAFVDDDGLSPARVGRYYVPPTAAKSTVTAGTAHGSNPRIDRVVVSTAGVVSLVAGTASGGATLVNLTGAAAIPSDSLLLADVLVPAADTTLSNSQIRDRRKWARGAYKSIETAGTTYTGNTGLFALVSASVNPRIECSGAPMRATLHSTLSIIDGAVVTFDLAVDGVAEGKLIEAQHPAGSYLTALTARWDFTPSAGSHRIAPMWDASDATLGGGIEFFQWTVEEILRPNRANNETTSG